MATFRYTAKNERGQEVSGQLDALNLDEARELLAQRGWQVHEVFPTNSADATGPVDPLTVIEAEEVGSRLAELGASRLPLAAGLRAAAEDSDNRRIAAALEMLAERVERGESLEAIFREASQTFPAHVGGLVIAASRTGELGLALSELLDHQQARHTLRQGILQSLAYPLFVVCLALAVLGVLILSISIPFERMFAEFGLQLPYVTTLFFWLRDYGLLVVVGIAAAVAVVGVVIRVGLGRSAWLRFLTTIPLFGPLWYWTGIAEWSSLLGILLRHQIPLPEALRLAAGGVSHAYLGHVSAGLAEATGQGQKLTECLTSNRRLPASLLPLVRWGEQFGALPDAFGAVHELFSRRALIRGLLLRSLLPPILFVGIASGIMLVVVALFMPLLSLIQGLS